MFISWSSTPSNAYEETRSALSLGLPLGWQDPSYTSLFLLPTRAHTGRKLEAELVLTLSHSDTECRHSKYRANHQVPKPRQCFRSQNPLWFPVSAGQDPQ